MSCSKLNANLVGEEEPDLVVVSTDMEPDDLIALKQLAPVMKESPNLVVVVGEGKRSKAAMARNLLDCLGISHAVVTDGQLSDKDYPDEMHTAFGPVEERFSIQAVECIRGKLETAKNPLFIVMKPPRELLVIAETAPLLLLGATVVIYGSFNFRSVFHDKEGLLRLFNGVVRKTIVYESFLATGDKKNSVDKKRKLTETEPDSECIFQFAEAHQNEPFWRGFLLSVQLWNNHILVDCLKSVMEATQEIQDTLAMEPIVWQHAKKPKGRVDRNWKVAQNIISAESNQFVMADCAMAALLCDDKPVTGVHGYLAFDGDYTKPDERIGGSCFFVRHLDFEQTARLIFNQVTKK